MVVLLHPVLQTKRSTVYVDHLMVATSMMPLLLTYVVSDQLVLYSEQIRISGPVVESMEVQLPTVQHSTLILSHVHHLQGLPMTIPTTSLDLLMR
jgi:hypothetical protein